MILAACDKIYLSRAKTLIRSCARHAPEQVFYLYLINTDTLFDREINTWHPRLIIERAWWPYDPATWRAKMSSARSVLLEKVLENYREKSVYLDSDIIVRSPITEIFSILDDHDLTVKYRPQLNQRGPAGTDFAGKFNAGVIGIRPSPIGLKFARSYNRLVQDHLTSGKPLVQYLEDEKIMSWIDQELLFVAYLENKEEVHFKPLPDKYNDAKFDSNSAIWHGKGSAYHHPLFTVERFRYDVPVLHHPLGILSRGLRLARDLRRSLR